MLVKHVWLIPGKLTEFNGKRELQDDHQWRIGVTIANVGGSAAHVIDSSLLIGRLGIGPIEGLLPPMPPYGTKYRFPSFMIQAGETAGKDYRTGCQ